MGLDEAELRAALDDGRYTAAVEADNHEARALGASLVCVGRPYVWGLGAFGEDAIEGATQVFDLPSNGNGGEARCLAISRFPVALAEKAALARRMADRMGARGRAGAVRSDGTSSAGRVGKSSKTAAC